MATDPSRIRDPALRARLTVKERIALRSAGVSLEVDMFTLDDSSSIDYRRSTTWVQ